MKIVKKPLKVGDRVKAQTSWVHASGKGKVIRIEKDGDYYVKLDTGSKYYYSRSELTKLKQPKLPDVVDGWEVGDQAYVSGVDYVSIDCDTYMSISHGNDVVYVPMKAIEAAITYRKANPL